MPYVHIAKHDWWPTYELLSAEEFGEFGLTEVPQDVIDRWRTCKAEFAALQRLLRGLYGDELLPTHDYLHYLPADNYPAP